jgi:hypothetical protein
MMISLTYVVPAVRNLPGQGTPTPPVIPPTSFIELENSTFLVELQNNTDLVGLQNNI